MTSDNRFGVHPREAGTVVVMGLSAGRKLTREDALELVSRVIVGCDLEPSAVDRACTALEDGAPAAPPKALPPPPPPKATVPPPRGVTNRQREANARKAAGLAPEPDPE